MRIRDILKKKYVWIPGIVILSAALLVGGVCISWNVIMEIFGNSIEHTFGVIEKQPSGILFTPENVTDVNYNNYNNFINENSMDCRDGYFAWLNRGVNSNTLIVADKNGSCQSFDGIGRSFQLDGDLVYYTDASYRLCVRDLKSGQVSVIAQDVFDFIVFEKWIVYDLAKSITDGFGIHTSSETDVSLFVYDTESKTTKKLLDEAREYFIYQKELYVLNDMGNHLVKVDLENATVTTVFQSDEVYVMEDVMPSGKYLLYYGGWEVDLYVYNRENGEVTTLICSEIGDNTEGASYIADDENIFVSVQRCVGDKFSFEIDHEDNGLWRIDPETLTAEKVLPDVFYGLYLTDGFLYGRKDGRIYQIDTKTYEMKVLAQ